MRKGDDGGEKRGKKNGGKKKKIKTYLVATNVVASRPPNGDRLQSRPLVPISLLGRRNGNMNTSVDLLLYEFPR